MLFANGCIPGEVKPVPIPEEEKEESNGCSIACKTLQELGCEEGKPTPEGATCKQVCENMEKNGMPFDTSCIAAIKNCEQLDSCFN